MSLAIFVSETANVRSAAAEEAHPSFAACASKWLAASTNGSPVRRAISAMTAAANSGCELMPVPTAVPPSGSS